MRCSLGRFQTTAATDGDGSSRAAPRIRLTGFACLSAASCGSCIGVRDSARLEEVIPWLRQLGLRVDEAKRGAAMCDGMPDASLEDRVRFGLSGLARDRFRRTAAYGRAAG